MPDTSWEARHPSCVERFAFDFWADDGHLAGFAAVTFRPQGAWYWAGLVGRTRHYVLVKELDVPRPRRDADFDIRAEALWAGHTCETAFEHWSIGLEAFGLAFEDPDGAVGPELGDRTGLGFDLEWETSGAPPTGADGDYQQRGRMHGEILIGSGARVESIAFDGPATRRHAWSADLTASLDGPGGAAPRQPIYRAPIQLAPGPPPEVLERFLIDQPGGGYGWTERLSRWPPGTGTG